MANLATIVNNILADSGIDDVNVAVITGSNQFNGSQAITGSLTVTGQIVAQTINVQQVTSSIVYSCGSNIFGNSLSNTQQFTGSMLATGSLTLVGPMVGSSTVCGVIGTFNCIGIGTSTPNTTLHISGTPGLNDPSIRLTDCAVSGNGGNVYISADKKGVGYNNLTTVAFSHTFSGGGSASPYLTIDSNGISCFACQVCAPTALITNNIIVGTTYGTTAQFSFGSTTGAQTTANLTDAGVRCGILEVLATGGSAGNGGALVLGTDTWGTGVGKGQIALKSLLVNGAGCGTSDLAFSLRNDPSCSNLTERMRITSGGNVGIGTPSPVTTNLVGSVTIVKSYNGDTPPSPSAQSYDINQSNLYLFGRNAGLTLVGALNEEAVIAFANSSDPYIGGIRYSMGSGADSGDFYIQTGGTNERFRITSTGISCFACRIGVGTFPSLTLGPAGGPGNSLHIHGAISDGGLLLSSQNCGDGAYLGEIQFATLSTSSSQKKGATIASKLTAASNSTVTGNLEFYTTNAGTEALRLSISATGIACFASTVCLPTSNTSLVAGTYGTISNVGGIDTNIGNNAYYDGIDWRRFAAQEAARIYINRDSFSFLRKSSDSAGTTISWDNTLFLGSSGIACFACQVCAPNFKFGSAGNIQSCVFSIGASTEKTVTICTDGGGALNGTAIIAVGLYVNGAGTSSTASWTVGGFIGSGMAIVETARSVNLYACIGSLSNPASCLAFKVGNCFGSNTMDVSVMVISANANVAALKIY
jgi:hypothetical protein